ncbi:MAG: glycosyltransferase [Daejeonella sp.]|uniref:glycosyltransferase n=1 Tax=Daejeonella sp. TaxID=2805397 RepID=UPI0027370AE9|nr:glycosyltransferase [Daejeonella sp.]MDP3467512.1 glycosyltransferase [Daejeonella sp.]
MVEKIIVVNASALRSGGALTILHQFINAIPDDNITYLVFVDRSVVITHSKKNLRLVHVNVTSFLNRIMWDAFGVKKWLKINNVNPAITVSLQNTNFQVGYKIPNYIYYHQPIPLFSNKWNLFKKGERSLWFYKYIYPFFVKIFMNSRTEIFVQLEFIKTEFVKKFDFNETKVHVIFPDLEIPQTAEISRVQLEQKKINLFYPAAPYIYKDHALIFQAFKLIDTLLTNKIVLYLTTVKDEIELQPNYENIDIVFLDKISHGEVIWLFNNVDALIFPSYIETLGLPLIEAASFGLPIIVADLPYSREVLDGYSGVKYLNYQDVGAWGDAIIELCLAKGKKYESYTKGNTKSWKDFFRIIKKTL